MQAPKNYEYFGARKKIVREIENKVLTTSVNRGSLIPYWLPCHQ